jgi:23S rRNA (guanosine2251-2'-O)-methyltransferase
MREILGGINSVTEALRGQRKFHKIYVEQERHNPRIEEILVLAQKKSVPIKTSSRKDLERFYPQAPHQGVVAEVEPYVYAELDDIVAKASSEEGSILLVLDGIENPQNLGSIIRTAECAGVKGIILPRHRSVGVTPAVVRASAGATEHTAVVQETNLVNTLKTLKKAGFWVIGADMTGKQEYFHTQMPYPAVLVIGSEGRGIRRLVKENCDLLVRIPMFGQVNSLNASISAALLIYELVRQKKNVEKLADNG